MHIKEKISKKLVLKTCLIHFEILKRGTSKMTGSYLKGHLKNKLNLART